MWIIYALSHDFDISVYTRGGFDLEELNALAGTAVPSSVVTLRQSRAELGRPFGAIDSLYFYRSLQRFGASYALRVTASGVLPWGRPALHFMSSIEWSQDLVRCADLRHFGSLRSRVSRWLVRKASQSSPATVHDLFVANSFWLKQKCAPVCPGPIQVIYPVVPCQRSSVQWHQREEAVLVFGRISPEKRIEDAIRIVECARARGFPGRLIIAGPNGAADYVAHIQDIATKHDWIQVLPAQFGQAKASLLARVKYGLNTCRIEAFGISTAEMAGSGIIVLVPTDTGQSEIVESQRQLFSTEAEAVECLLSLSASYKDQLRLHSKAVAAGVRFGAQPFVKGVRAIAQQLLTKPVSED